MSETLQEELLKMISFIPGVVGLASADLTKSNMSLPEARWANGVDVEMITEGKYSVSIAIIVNKDIKTKIVVSEIESSVSSLFKKNKLRLSDLNIFVRGVK